MCGIVYVRRLDDKAASPQLLKRYKKQRTRGVEGFGFVPILGNGRVGALHRYMFENEVVAALEGLKSQHVLFHHRYPTSTENVPEAAHPIRISHNELAHDYYLVHNGVITNDEHLREQHTALGYRYTTELQTRLIATNGKEYEGGVSWNDSEALGIELARTIEGKQDLVKARGAIAYILLQAEKRSGKALAIYYGTNGENPLTVSYDERQLCIASEGGRAIEPFICYKRDLLRPDAVEVVSVPLERPLPVTRYPAYTRNSWEDTPSEYIGTTARGEDYRIERRSSRDEVDAKLFEVEAQLEEVENDLELARTELRDALDRGDDTTVSLYQVEVETLESDRKRLERMYEDLSLSLV